VKIAIFDMDGTLIDSAKDITISINAVREQNHSLSPLDEAFVIEAINREHRTLSELFYETPQYEKRDQLLFEEHYHEQCIQNVYLYTGISELLHSLKEQEIKLSVATNAPTQFAKRMLLECGVSHYFDYIIGADKVSKAKPDKEMLECILSGYGFKPEHKALMIGDNSKDMQAAINAGIEGAFATWGFSSESDHHRVLSHPQEIIEFFNA